ncbi:MAG: 16S rRNA (guanine(527)-N(7))-methyltransferase RsmG, partial [Mycoplasma sp.]|nr:16S rRNA (guanine(527)-N(7))-methyltransferase RsmG [Mycoplasma sp.]
MNKEKFIENILKYFPHVNSDYFISKIDIWVQVLREQNKKYNLTRLDTDELIYRDYFWNSLLPFSKIDFSKNKSILDIGSGSGIPGIILKIVFPNLKLTIVEANLKKCKFMQLLCESLKINDVEIINQRCEIYAHSAIEKF